MNGKLCRQVTVLLIGLATTVSAQPNVRVVTGDAPARGFVSQGAPIHPFCVDFPLERSSRTQPKELAECMDSRVTPKASPNGWLSAEYPIERGERFVSFPPYASYRVLARLADRFLVATDKSGGASGQFTELFWVLLTPAQVLVVQDETGGDRCLGGLGDYQLRGAMLTFSQSQSARDLIGLSGARIPAALTAGLRTGYHACDGRARYEYDLGTQRMQLAEVQLNQPDPPDAADKSAQACFDRLVLAYSKKGLSRLSANQLKRFGQDFSSCGRP